MAQKDKRGGYRKGLRQLTIRIPDVLFDAIELKSKSSGVPSAKIARDIIMGSPEMVDWLALAKQQNTKKEG